MSQSVLLLIILVEGFVTISAEILTIRQLLPVVGGSVIVTSLIIGVFLLFLAYGYRQGGQHRLHYEAILKRNFALATVWLGIGLSYVFIFWYFTFFRHFFGLSINILWILTSYLLLVTAPLVYILGQTVPITMNMIRQSSTVGATGGKILHLSTVGSFLGAVITSVFLMSYLGVAWTIMINCVLLTSLVLLLFSTNIGQKRDFLILFGLLILLVIVYRFNITIEKNVFAAANAHGNYEILKDNTKHSKTLLVNESHSSYLDAKLHAFPYIELIKRVLFQDLKLENKDILVLGAGGFTLSAEDPHQNRFIYVDIDKDIKNIVQEHFLKDIHGEFVAQDARYFLEQSPRKFDAIISDVYSSARTVPAHLLTQEYFRLMNTTLNEGGVGIINIVARPDLKDNYSQWVDNTIRSVFKQCMSIPLKYSNQVSNIIYVCQKSKDEHEIQIKKLYTDDLNKVTIDFFRSISN